MSVGNLALAIKETWCASESGVCNCEGIAPSSGGVCARVAPGRSGRKAS